MNDIRRGDRVKVKRVDHSYYADYRGLEGQVVQIRNYGCYRCRVEFLPPTPWMNFDADELEVVEGE